MRSSILSMLFFMAFALQGFGHPSYSLIIDSNGDLIFSDVLHNWGTIWKFSESNVLTAIHKNQHCHFMFKDHNDRIWGTDHQYIERTNSNRNSLWRLDKDGELQTMIEYTEDATLFSGVNFVVDHQGDIYFDYEGQLYKRSQEGNPKLFCSQKFEWINSLQMDHLGHIYVVDSRGENGSVYQINKNGNSTLIASNLKETKPQDPPYEDPRHNMLFGCFIDQQSNIYIANSGSRRVSKIDVAGQIDQIYKSENPWYPLAINMKNGRLLVMELAYIPNQGHKGPRIVMLDGEVKKILVDVENPPSKQSVEQKRSQGMREKEQGQTSLNLWIYIGMGFLVLALGWSAISKIIQP